MCAQLCLAFVSVLLPVVSKEMACRVKQVSVLGQGHHRVCGCARGSLWVQVNELQRRQRKDHEKEVKRREKLQEKEKSERAAQAKLKMEEEAYQLQVRCIWTHEKTAST